MVRRARRFLYASTYFYQYDRYGREYATELLAACGRGVDVWLIIDGFGQRLARTLMDREERRRVADLFVALRRAGVHLVIYRAPHRLQRILGAGLHIKVQVADDGEAILASGNISATSFERWNEFAVALRGPIAAQLLEVLMGFIAAPDRSHLDLLRSQNQDRAWLPAATYCVAGCPTDDPSSLSPLVQRRPNPLTAELIRLIDGARRTVRITTFYFKPVPTLFQALERAALRGVAIEIHHSHRRALAPSDAPWVAATYYYRRCLDLGMRLYENRRGEHSKIIIADDRWAAFGTYNLEHAADDRLAEVMVFTGEPATVAELCRFVRRLRRDPDNVAVDPIGLSSLPLAVKAKRLAIYPFRRWV
jgi:cardiolipin synthase